MISTAKTTLRMLMADVNFVQSVALLAARIWIAKVFFYSGLTKIKTWDSTLTLFEYEYAVPVLPTEVAAYMATAGELILPVLLVFGLFTPIAALGLFIMTLVIEFLVYPGTTEHYYWMLLLGILMTHGSGKLGLDHFIKKKFL
ncbi:MAG: DoxX family protein [Pseudomonadota bacterium]|nr:DoxX family protein [Pseudomonadota bacterium]